MKNRVLAFVIGTIVVVALALAVVVAGADPGYQCLTSADGTLIKTENAIGPNFDTISSTFPILKVVVKSGQGCIEVYPTNTAPTCYSVSINQNPNPTQVSVSRIGGGSECQGISHLEAVIGSTGDKCVVTSTVYSDWSSWVWNDFYWQRYRTITILDQDGETVCGSSKEWEYKYPDGAFYAVADCDGWTLYFKLSCESDAEVVDSGRWLDTTTDESRLVAGVYNDMKYAIRVIEPQNCDECVPEHVFVWFHERGCNLRQRGGPIGGQTRPFVPMQEYYCCPKSIYPTDEGWTGRYINSCQRSQEYTYWNELPQFNRPFICE